MSNYYTNIKAGIVTALGTATKVRNIYDYEPTLPAGYPAIAVTPFGGNGEFLDTLRVKRNFQFTVRLYQERIQIGPQEAERVLTALADEVVAIFDGFTFTTLGNTVEFNEPPEVRFGYLNVPDADVRTCEINVIGVAAQ